MEKTNKFLGIGILLLACLVLPIVAGTSMTVPTTGGNYSSTISLAVTVTDSVLATGMTNVSCHYNATGGSAEPGEATAFTEIINSSANQTSFTDSVSISAFSDLRTYNITCFVYNVSDLNSTLSATTVTVDNTNPTVSLSIPLSGDNENFGRSVQYQCNTTDATDTSVATTFNVTHPADDTTSVTTLSTSLVLQEFTDTDFEGDYVFSCYALDSAGNNAISSSTVTIDDLGRIISVKNNTSGSSNMLLWGLVAILVVFALTKKK